MLAERTPTNVVSHFPLITACVVESARRLVEAYDANGEKAEACQMELSQLVESVALLGVVAA